MQVQHGDVLHDLVIGALQKGGINRRHRHHSLLGKTACHGNRVFLRNTHVEEAFGVFPHEFEKPRASRHGGRNRADPVVLPGKLHHGLPEGIGIGFDFFRQLFPGFRVKRSDSVKFCRVFLGKPVAAALFRDHMHHHRLAQPLRCGKQGDQPRQVVAVHRPQIGKAHIFKQGRGQQKPFQSVFQPPGHPVRRSANGSLLHDFPVPALGLQIMPAGAQPGQVPGHTAHVPADGHFIVVEDNHHRLAAHRSVVQPLIGHAAGAGAVPDQGDHIIVLMQKRSRPRHTQGDGNRAGSMSRHEGVRIALRRLGKTGQAAVLPQMRKIRLASGQQLMHIRLMPHIKNQAVYLGIKNGFDGHAQLHHAQVSGQMSAGSGDVGDQKVPDFPTKLGSLPVIQRSKVVMAVDFL